MEPSEKKKNEQAEGIIGELQAKIASKMDVGKFFAGFITLLIGILGSPKIYGG